MQYAARSTHAGSRATSLGLVLLLHVALVYALVSGLARRIVDVVHAPIQTKILEEVRKPPPPEEVVPPPPQFTPPPPDYIPPPEIRIARPPPAPIVAVTHAPPPEQVTITPTSPAPPAPVVAAAPPAPTPVPPAPKPARAVTAGVACSNYRTAMGDAAYPRRARQQGIDHGSALIQFTLEPDGSVADVRPVQASSPIFADSSMAIVRQLRCEGQGRAVIVRVPFDYRLE